eukprot:jgi/Tetstr1/454569/TSEL_041464.t1
MAAPADASQGLPIHRAHVCTGAAAIAVSGSTQKMMGSRAKSGRKPDDPKVKLVWRTLAILVVFCRLPFSIVENPSFKAFVWLLDATVPLPTRRKLGVVIAYDLWMSRKTEDNLSLDIHFIDRGWIWHHYHAGIIVSCKDSSAGDIAPRMEPATLSS